MFYRLFDLTVQSSIVLPAPTSKSVTESVVIEIDCGALEPPLLQVDQNYSYDVNSSHGLFWHRGVATLSIRGGKHIIVDPEPGVEESVVANSLVGTPMGVLLLQRGYFVMHGSAVVVDGKCIVFVGSSGLGKSTCALSMVQAGGQLLTDDVVAVDQAGVLPHSVLPGMPWMKVNETVGSLLGIEEHRLCPPGPGAYKHTYDLQDDQFHGSSAALEAVFIPAWGDDFAIEQLSPREAMIQMVPHSYSPSPQSKYPEETEKFIRNTAALVETVPCYKLTRPYDIKRMQELPQIILEHLRK